MEDRRVPILKSAVTQRVEQIREAATLSEGGERRTIPKEYFETLTDDPDSMSAFNNFGGNFQKGS